MDQTRKQARLEFSGVAGQLLGTEGGGWDDALDGCSTSPRWRWRPSRSAGRRRCWRWRSSTPRSRVQFGRPIGSLPGHQAQVRRHAARGRVGQVGRLLRGLGRGRGQRRAAGGGLAGQGLLLGRVLPRRGREHPDPRRHRLHLGARRPPLLQAGQVAPSCCSATPRTTASCWPSASASEPARAQGARNRGFSMSSGVHPRGADAGLHRDGSPAGMATR